MDDYYIESDDDNDDDNNNDNNELELVEEINSENSFVGVNIAEFDDDILFY
jgi:hypothetical protein